MMANERLRAALVRGQWTLPKFAETLGVDPKTVERWITKERIPHRRTAYAVAARLGEDPAYLWPDLGRPPVTDGSLGEVITVYPERRAVPNSLWLSVLQPAERQVDLLVYAGLHLPEANPEWPTEIERKCRESARVRLAFGDPGCESVRARGEEEGVGDGLASRIRYALAWYGPVLRCPNLEVRFHSTVLYNSIFRSDDQMLVNAHILGVPAFRAPVLHLRRIPGGPLFDTYAECFEKVWASARMTETAGASPHGAH
jgi:transcriptional regulator with XRE-family HTH domain